MNLIKEILESSRHNSFGLLKEDISTFHHQLTSFISQFDKMIEQNHQNVDDLVNMIGHDKPIADCKASLEKSLIHLEKLYQTVERVEQTDYSE